MKTIILSLIFTYSLFSYSQEYVPMLEEGNIWYVEKLSGLHDECWDDDCDQLLGYSYIKFYWDGETVLNGVTYKNLKAINLTAQEQGYNCYPFEGFIAYLREDAEERKVYKWNPNQNAEYVLYDFTLDIGDYYPEESEIYNTYPLKSIETGTVFDASVRAYDFAEEDNSFEKWFIYEGIGSANGILFPPMGVPFECGFWLYGMETSSGVSWNSDFLKVEDLDQPDKSNLVLFYDKSKNQFQIRAAFEEPLEILIFSTAGTLVESVVTMTNQDFSIKISEKGSYLYKVWDAEGNTWSGKFLYP